MAPPRSGGGGGSFGGSFGGLGGLGGLRSPASLLVLAGLCVGGGFVGWRALAGRGAGSVRDRKSVV